MLKFNVLEDESLQAELNKFISALLPHENYEPSMYSQVLQIIFRYIRLEEFEMEYRILLQLLNELNKIKIQFEKTASVRLEQDRLIDYLERYINNAITNPELGVKEWLEYEGLASNLSIETNREEACLKVCDRVITLYDECYDLGVSASEVVNEEPALRQAFLVHCANVCLNTQSAIVREGVRIGRKKYQGAEDWLRYSAYASAEIQERLNSVESSATLTLDSIEKSSDLLQSLGEFYVPIAKYGIPEIDDYTPILRHRLVVVVGRENIGKTKFAVDQAVNILMAGGKVVYMCGETQKAKVYSDVIINYVWKMYHVIIRPKHIAEPSTCPEVLQRCVRMAIDTIVSGGLLTLADAFEYSTVYTELQAMYDKVGFDACIIDHSCALKGTAGTGSLKDKIDALSSAVVRFKKDNPVCIMVTSHPSTDAKDSDSRGKITNNSPTKGSSNLSADADEVFFLRDDETYRKQNKVILENTKRRDAGRITEYVVLTKKFEVSTFIYDASAQKIDVQDEMKANQQDAMLDAMYGAYEAEEGGYVD